MSGAVGATPACHVGEKAACHAAGSPGVDRPAEFTFRNHKQRRANHSRNSRTKRKIKQRVIDRDEGRCWLCGGFVVGGVPQYHPLEATLDHVVPFSQGGKFTFANLRLAHRKCNEQRGAGPVA